MSAHRVDYDRLAANYSSRYDFNSLQEIGKKLERLAEGCGTALEVGCGTGRWLPEVARTARFIVGIDASLGMLRQNHSGAPLVNAPANRLPFREGTFDLIFCVNALHHFDDKPSFIADAAKVLNPGGTLAIVGIDPRTIRQRYLYEYFESTLETDLARYPSFGELIDWMAAAGLDDVEHTIVHTWRSRFEGSEILNDPFLKQESNSSLALLNERQYEAGLRRIEAAAQSGAVFDTVLPFGMTTGKRAPVISSFR
jgi:ubiquinone/menaquinone biosynthesis C-methylase UbiE